ncbi:hypothetical protein ZIOFF_055687 [Zingiber officinale]|uniref:Uncharacterized protein n=1 Tax=Zingiber officinale TaxID=94328 RepID=A0A8J5FHZ1_ZINOF|nr:hypothetical protein ZIOFF_055687 [Zingiber officinale]
MGILGEKNGMLPLKHLINLEAKSSFSYFLQELVDWELILLQQMLSFSMIVTGIHKLICKHRIVLIELGKRKKFKCSVSVLSLQLRTK